MAGIAGILRLDGGNAEVSILRDMLHVLAHRGPDGEEVRAEGCIALGHLALHTTPGTEFELQPSSDESGRLWITLDGRLDNRDELADAVDPRAPRSAVSDAALLLRAYERWGEDAISRLIGDFAFALWDGRRRTLICARDALGMRPLYYRVDEETFSFASELGALLAHPPVRARLRPNEGFLGEHLAARPVHLEDTAVQGVLRLRAAHVLVVTSGGLCQRRYWEPQPQELRCRTDEEYADKCREVLKTAVACRLRSQTPVGVLLSGGLDSSSVLSLGASLWRSGRVRSPGVVALSLVFPGRSYDERPYIDATSDACGIPSHILQGGAIDDATLLASLNRSLDLPDAPTGEALLRPLLAAARAQGLRVILTGVGGDQWLQGSDFYYADLISQGRWRTLIHLLLRTAADSPFDRSLGLVLRAGVLPLIPLRARRVARAVLPRRLVPPWVEPAFARRVDLEARLRRPALTPWPHSYAAADVRSLLESGWEALMKEQADRCSAAYGIEYRHPFLDRRLIEFALSLPEDQRQRAEGGKIVLRSAMRGHLPELVRRRVSKAHYSELYLQSFAALGGKACFDRLAIADLGWVNASRVQRMYEAGVTAAASGDDRYAASMIPLWQVLSVERWYRALFVDNGRELLHGRSRQTS